MIYMVQRISAPDGIERCIEIRDPIWQKLNYFMVLKGLYQTTPLMTIDLMEQLLEGDLSADPTNLNQKEIVNFLEENTIENTGVHAQLSFQFKVLFIDTHVFYRHAFLDSDQELAPGISDFGSFNVRAGIGF